VERRATAAAPCVTVGGWLRARPRAASRWPRIAAPRCAAAAAAPCAPDALAASPARPLPADLARPGARVLLLGEGNFTLAAALAAQWPSLCVTASSLESEADAVALWGAGPALAALAARGVRRLHGVDATALEASPVAGQRFDRVLFSFPHGGRKARVASCRGVVVRTPDAR
jgi:hypothetical protein